MPPAIPEGTQVWRPRASVAMENGGNLRDPQPFERGLHHHLACKPHAGRAPLEPLVRVFADGTQAAMKVADPDPEKDPADRGQHRVADVAVRPGHRAGVDSTLEPVAYHQVGAGP